MKFKTIMMSLLLSSCVISAFATSGEPNKQEPLPFKSLTSSLQSTEVVAKPLSTSCTVVVKFGKITSTVTSTCDCTMKEACASAYKLATILL